MKRRPREAGTSWPLSVRVAAAGFLLAQLVVLPGAASPFRLPKEAVALAVLAIALAAAVAAAARSRVLRLPRGVLTWVLLALPALQLLSTLWSTLPTRALESALLSSLWIAGIFWLATEEARSRRLLWAATILGVVVSAAVMLLQRAGLEPFELVRASARGRLALTGLTGNPADLAMAAVLVLPVLLLWSVEGLRPRLARAAAAFLAVALLVTQTLAGAAALAAVLLVWLVRHGSTRLKIAAVVLAAVAFAAALGLGLGERLLQAGRQAGAGDWYRLLSARGDGWTAALQMIGEHPVTGVGAANFSVLYYPSRLAWLERTGGVGGRGELQSHFEWAHNDPLQMLAELGIAGAVWMVGLAWALLRCRSRAGPLLPLTAAALAPFLLLHYPTHIAVGLIPLTLALADVLALCAQPRQLAWRRGRSAVALLLVIVLAAAAWWQLRRVAFDLWVGGLEMRMALSKESAPEARARLGATVEAQLLPRIRTLPSHAPLLWRTVGRARLLQGDSVGAEAAFRSSWELWPHEDAEFHLGISLAAQGRRTEALAHLGRVCRTNPSLLRLIGDESLRRAVEDLLAAYERP